MAHELLVDGEYTNKADLWSVGVIAYMLLSGTKPFWYVFNEKYVYMSLMFFNTMS